MTWEIRHEGSPQSVPGLTLAQIVEGLQDGRWEPTDEVKGPGDGQWQAIENHPALAETVADMEAVPPVREDETRLDMNALIDVTLVLLIFFILTTTHAAAIQKMVQIPAVSEQTGAKRVKQSDVKKFMIRLKADEPVKGRPTIEVEGRKADVVGPDGGLDADRLKGLLEPYVQANPPRRELLLEAAGVRWGLVIAIQDAARAAGVARVHHVNRPAAGARKK